MYVYNEIYTKTYFCNLWRSVRQGTSGNFCFFINVLSFLFINLNPWGYLFSKGIIHSVKSNYICTHITPVCFWITEKVHFKEFLYSWSSTRRRLFPKLIFCFVLLIWFNLFLCAPSLVLLDDFSHSWYTIFLVFTILLSVWRCAIVEIYFLRRAWY